MTRPRRSLHRAFSKFLFEHRVRFCLPIRLGRRTDTVWCFGFEDVSHCIVGWINTHEITIAVEWQGEVRDLILDLDTRPIRTSKGFVCDLCEGAQQSTFATREALWVDHLFEPLLAWINNTLAPTKWLLLTGGEDDGFTSARLLRDRPEHSLGWGQSPMLLPVRIDPSHQPGWTALPTDRRSMNDVG